MRDAAVRTLEALATRCSEQAALTALFGDTFKAVAGAELPQRMSLLSGLGALAASPAARACPDAAPQLAAFAAREPTDEAKASALDALARWLRPQQALHADVAAALTASFASDKEHTRQLHMRALGDALEGANLAGWEKLVEPLLKCTATALATPARRTDLPYALRVLVQLAARDAALAQRLEKEGAWAAVLRSNAALYSDALTARLSPRDSCALAALLGALMALHPDRALAADDAVFAAVVRLLLHADRAVRTAAARAVPAANAALSALLVAAFERHVAALAAPAPAPALVASALQSVARGLFADKAAQSDARALYFVLAHHPLVAVNAHHPLQGAARALEHSEAVCARLFADDLLGRGGAAVHAALVGAAGTIVRTLPHGAALLAEKSVAVLAERAAAEVSSDDMGILATPEGTPFGKPVTSDEYVPRVRENRNVKQSKTERMYRKQGTDEQWERQVREELERKKKGASAGPELTEQEREALDALLAKESAVRARLTAVRTRVIRALDMLRSAARAAPVAVNGTLPTVYAAVLALCASPLVSASAAAALQALAVTCPRPLAAHARLLAVTAGRVYGTEEARREVSGSFLVEVLEGAVERAVATCKEAPLPAPSFVVVFPLLREALTRAYSLASQDAALQSLETHAAQPGAYPRAAVAEVLLRVMVLVPRLADRARAALLRLAPLLTAPDSRALLVHGLECAQPAVRGAALHALRAMPSGALGADEATAAHLWLVRADADEENHALAAQLWSAYARPLTLSAVGTLNALLGNPDPAMRKMTATAVAAGWRECKADVGEVLRATFALYEENLPFVDQKSDPLWETRSGIASLIGAASVVVTARELPEVFQFLIGTALYDQHDQVRAQLVQAGIDLINAAAAAGADLSATVLPIFEKHLEAPSDNEPATDQVREAVVVFMGGAARSLAATDPKLKLIIAKLIEVLHTPSESVQRAVAQYLVSLMSATKESAQEVDAFIATLLERLRTGKSSTDRRGAAYGLAGVVKGLGMGSLKNNNIMPQLLHMLEDKRHISARQGALFAFECLSNTLGRLFEPYIISLLSPLLNCFGDTSAEIRQAAADSARTIMGQLSGPGLKVILPSLLKGLESGAWRTKQGSIELLGALSNCNPKQLSACLPQIVPRIIAAMSDTHAKVQEAAKEALNEIGSVIRNPEILQLIPLVIKALDDPNKHADEALEALINTSFVHAIDAPSLALVIPLLHRGLTERSTATKKRAAQIVGSICSLVDQKELIPYMDVLLPDVKATLVDPIPEVRAISSKAIGALIKALGEEQFPDVVPFLLDSMKTDAGPVERAGAAQGLADVLAGLPPSRLEALLPEIVALTAHPKANVREGFLSVFLFLPAAFGMRFQAYLPQALPCILQGLADETEVVRDVSMRAGSVIVTAYGATAMEMLLAPLETGLFNANWRIRQSSVQLLGDLLARLGGRVEGTQDETVIAATQNKNITAALGSARRERVLASLCMLRSDSSSVVRQQAMLVWKSFIDNTPKTLREILPTLMQMIVKGLGDASDDKRQTAGRTLGELVRKLGERILPEVIPMLEKGLESKEPVTRQGVCLGLSEVLSSAARNQLGAYLAVVIPCVRKALCDDLPEVREAAAQAFDTLYENVGSRAVDEVLPILLKDIEKSSDALDGLKQIITVRSSVILPYLLPIVMEPPITSANAAALASIADVAGKAIYQHLSSVLPALLDAMYDGSDETGKENARKAAVAIIGEVRDDGVHLLFREFFTHIKSPSAVRRRGTAFLIGSFLASAQCEYDSYVGSILLALMLLLADEDVDAQKQTIGALEALSKVAKKDNFNYVSTIRSAMRQVSEILERSKRGPLVPGFCLPKGLAGVFPILLNALMTAPADAREAAAQGITEAVQLTSADALKPYILQVVGPLIRIIGERFPAPVKAAILAALSEMLGKVGAAMKAFLSSLQTIFVKALSDPAPTVRVNAAEALGKLVPLGAKVEALVGELIAGVRANPSMQDTFVAAITRVVLAAPALDAKVVALVAPTLAELLETDEEAVRRAAARLAAALVQAAPEANALDVLRSLVGEPRNLRHKLGLSAALPAALQADRAKSYRCASKCLAEVVAYVAKDAADDRVPVRLGAAQSAGQLLLGNHGASELLKALAALVADAASPDVRLAAVQAVKRWARRNAATQAHLAMLVPPLVERVKDRLAMPVKLAAERALLHLLSVKKGAGVAEEFSKTLGNAAAATFLVDYTRRVLAKLPEESDDDNSP